MGDMSDCILEGLVCMHCGDIIDFEEPGYPRSCDSCSDLYDDDLGVMLNE